MTRRSLVLVTALALTALPSLAAAQHSYGDGFGIGGVLLPSGSAFFSPADPRPSWESPE